MASDTPRFCPFCRECFEGVEVCPDHELRLVDFTDLPRQSEPRVVRDDTVLGPLEWRHGRGASAVGAVLAIVGFFLPLFTYVVGEQSVATGGMELATTRAPALWTIPFAGGVILAILGRRRTPGALRGARLVAPIVGAMPVMSLIYAGTRVAHAAAAATAATGVESIPGFGAGAWLVALGSLLMIVGGVRLGSMPKQRAIPHGAAPEGEGSIVVHDDDDDDA